MFCRQCGAEFRAGFYECTDCGVPLVDSLSDPEAADPVAPGPDPNIELVTVLETPDASAVPVVQSILRAAGIPYSVRDLHSLGMRPAAGSFGSATFELGTAVQVPADRAEEARRLLELSETDR